MSNYITETNKIIRHNKKVITEWSRRSIKSTDPELWIELGLHDDGTLGIYERHHNNPLDGSGRCPDYDVIAHCYDPHQEFDRGWLVECAKRALYVRVEETGVTFKVKPLRS